MKEFKFRENNLELSIEDKIFNIDISSFEDSEKLIKIANDALKISEDGNSKETIEKMIVMIEEAIDTILGEGATKEIFANRKINYLDIIDLLAFITEEIIEFRSKKLERVYSVNRQDEFTN